MTPEEHRAEAERLLAAWRELDDTDETDLRFGANVLAAAAVHAQLAGPPPVEPERRRFFYLRTVEGKMTHEAAMRAMQERLMGLAR